MKGGGAYYVISRGLGPAFGGAGGLLFWLSYSMNATFNVVAVTDVLQSSFVPESSWWSSRWGSVSISSLMLLPLAAIAYKGAGTFAKVNAVVFVALLLACVVTAGDLFFGHTSITLDAPDRTRSSFSSELLVSNLWPDPVSSEQCESAGAFGMFKQKHQICTGQLVFSVIFPAVVGMMEGLNLSGDLKKPGRSIPLGTFWAMAVAFVIYAALMIGQAGTMSREALQYKMDILQKSTVGGGSFVVLGVITACLSTVLGSLFGAARVLQAMSRDDVFPGLARAGFGHGTASGDEPRPAILVSYLLAQAGLFLGNLDDLAPLMTNLFLLTYALTDFTCFLLEVSGVPNFRPTFRFYSWQTSLTNSLLTVAAMFYLSAIYAGTTIAAALLILGLLMHRFRHQACEWNDVSQALFFRCARSSLLHMQLQHQDNKYWRPSVLLLVSSSTKIDMPGFLPLLVLLNRLKQTGLFVLGRAQICDALQSHPLGEDGTASGLEEWDEHRTPELCDLEQFQQEIALSLPSFKGFQQLALASNGRLACYNLALGAGLGPLLPDTVVIPLPRLDTSLQSPQLQVLDAPTAEAREFVEVLRDLTGLRKNVLVAANFHKVSKEEVEKACNIDMWIFENFREPPPPVAKTVSDSLEFASTEAVRHMSLLLQLGHLCACFEQRKHPPRLRLVQGEQAMLDSTARKGNLERWLQWARIPRAVAETVSLPASDLPTMFELPSLATVNHDADVILTLLPPPPTGNRGFAAVEYVNSLIDWTASLPPTLLVANGQGMPVISTDV
eukprot:CAMPEP_0197696258 /NCGR_PEP_ID=MMETSP1338-20131121/116397_1 /TAXON_ID=43686 ORGANISM="Pelagodinium beii, Strain RCC1491" /NCGR_SAMPLE_ID=MMETSP1338 /ASSEMBLY_ACC=CAM_ASM_000754 /LENGTH=781 /DNA_ID=CAMNT_0043279349 /DNA_START=189 /DNA_END=2534 /DNA_ORIENTATION=+